ncbi:hypothetical protein EJ08DRAFT_1618 [Tothia fuscella]|uniref:Uncharacterized protein n=1 Tax=Tothia fuscella TaxID=1048955 RepID=A0A9P4P1X0_9PEZI|nr:hypothetical protein EJ08DRAFT_1618 [Tothia fuscella]
MLYSLIIKEDLNYSVYGDICLSFLRCVFLPLLFFPLLLDFVLLHHSNGLTPQRSKRLANPPTFVTIITRRKQRSLTTVTIKLMTRTPLTSAPAPSLVGLPVPFGGGKPAVLASPQSKRKGNSILCIAY